MKPAVYIITNDFRTTLYIGVTGNLVQRMWAYKNGKGGKFARRYNLHRLVYVELCGDMDAAIRREKQLKRWRRAWKVELIRGMNPEWRDLAGEIMD